MTKFGKHIKEIKGAYRNFGDLLGPEGRILEYNSVVQFVYCTPDGIYEFSNYNVEQHSEEPNEYYKLEWVYGNKGVIGKPHLDTNGNKLGYIRNIDGDDVYYYTENGLYKNDDRHPETMELYYYHFYNDSLLGKQYNEMFVTGELGKLYEMSISITNQRGYLKSSGPFVLIDANKNFQSHKPPVQGFLVDEEGKVFDDFVEKYHKYLNLSPSDYNLVGPIVNYSREELFYDVKTRCGIVRMSERDENGKRMPWLVEKDSSYTKRDWYAEDEWY